MLSQAKISLEENKIIKLRWLAIIRNIWHHNVSGYEVGITNAHSQFTNLLYLMFSCKRETVPFGKSPFERK
jgi:hypothetical protein